MDNMQLHNLKKEHVQSKIKSLNSELWVELLVSHVKVIWFY